MTLAWTAMSRRGCGAFTSITLMKFSAALCSVVLLSAACAHVANAPVERETVATATARQQYNACMNREGQKLAADPANAEDIAAAAHGACWSEWQAYRSALMNGFAVEAHTAAERQLANDKADAILRQAEQDARRRVAEVIVERSLARGGTR